MRRRSVEQLETLFGATGARREPCLETETEVWLPDAARMVIWQNGALAEDRNGLTDGASSPFVGRRTLYDVLGARFVDLELREDRLVLRRGGLNGALCETWEPPDAVEPIVTHYESLDFVEAQPWSFQPFGHMVREVINGVTRRTVEDERTLQELLSGGYTLRMMELVGADRSRARPTIVHAPDPYQAVDRVVNDIRELHRRYPRGHFVIEAIDLKNEADRARVSSHVGTEKYFLEMHEPTFNRWATLGPAARQGSSWRYFQEKYGSLTWIVGDLTAGLSTFACGNVSGGGKCCLQLGETYDCSHYEDIEPGRGYDRAIVFHGGWPRDGFVMDTRVASPTGEFAIYGFCDDGPMPEWLPTADALPAPETIRPFGFWLEEHARPIIETLRGRLAKLQKPRD